MRHPLSLTTGPAFILPILKVKPGLPEGMNCVDPISCRLVSTLAYANGATSIGIPWVH